MSPASTAALRQQALAVRHRRAKSTPKKSTMAVYASLFVLIVAVVAIGYAAPQKADGVSSNVAPVAASVDEVMAANIAANAAQVADLSVKTEVLNNAVTAQLSQDYVLLSEDTTTKPQILQALSSNRKVTNYKVRSGDSLASIAAAFGISKETIKWVNDMTSDSVSVGKTLKILPVDGIIYTVKAGDTVASIASKYKVNESRLVLYNDLELGGLKTGQSLILPNATLPTNERPGYTAPVSYLRYSYGYVSDDVRGVDIYKYLSNGYNTSSGNTSTQGQCTWYAWERRREMGRPLPAGAILGNAVSWADRLHYGFGYAVDTVPERGAIIHDPRGYFGHVGVVERVNADGSLLISDMNYNYRAFAVTERVIPKSATGYFNYIH